MGLIMAQSSCVPQVQTDLGGTARIAALGGVLLFAALIGWAAITPIAGAVIAQGQAVVHGKPKQVQSLDGGIVAEIDVDSGDRVEAGQVLLRLDPTLLTASLDIARGKLAEALARQARLEAEQLGLETPAFNYAPLPFERPDTRLQEEGQRQIFAVRAELTRGRTAQFEERRAELGHQIAGIRGQIAAKREQLALLEEDLANVTKLAAQGLARGSQRLDLARSRAELLGQIAALEAEEAQQANSIRDAEIQTLQQQREFKESVVTDLRQATAEIEQLVPQILTLQAQLARVEIRAPVAGIVHEMAVTTVGGVVAPGSVILQVVPLDRGLDFELRLDPRFVDQVHPGQGAQVVMAALDPRLTPRLAGTVSSISPDTIADRTTGAHYYQVEVTIAPEELARLGPGVDLVPGMPIEAFLETGDRTVLRYFLKPFATQLARAFRER
jgi:HlyD family secretion protein